MTPAAEKAIIAAATALGMLLGLGVLAVAYIIAERDHQDRLGRPSLSDPRRQFGIGDGERLDVGIPRHPYAEQVDEGVRDVSVRCLAHVAILSPTKNART